jgi:cytidylate kinase
MRPVYLRGASVLRPDLACFAVAIDGPGGSGKSTAARLLAERLSMTYADTGAMYRAVALYNIRQRVDTANQEAVNASLDGIDIEMAGQRLLLNGEDVTDALRTQEVAEGSSVVAAYPAVREKLAALQRRIARFYRMRMLSCFYPLRRKNAPNGVLRN